MRAGLSARYIMNIGAPYTAQLRLTVECMSEAAAIISGRMILCCNARLAKLLKCEAHVLAGMDASSILDESGAALPGSHAASRTRTAAQVTLGALDGTRLPVTTPVQALAATAEQPGLLCATFIDLSSQYRERRTRRSGWCSHGQLGAGP
jgi:hypothetical protein